MTTSTPSTINTGTNPTSNPESNPTASAGPNAGSSTGSNSGSNSRLNPSSERGHSQGNADYGKTESTPSTTKLASAAHTAVEVAAEKLAHTEKVLREAGASSGANVSEYAHDAYDSAEVALVSVKEYINRNPLRSVGIALAAGFVLSSVLKR